MKRSPTNEYKFVYSVFGSFPMITAHIPKSIPEAVRTPFKYVGSTLGKSGLKIGDLANPIIKVPMTDITSTMIKARSLIVLEGKLIITRIGHYLLRIKHFLAHTLIEIAKFCKKKNNPFFKRVTTGYGNSIFRLAY
jgi:hypothetical protein